jgi:RimJ/RimL family protein N-acetyltransferase
LLLVTVESLCHSGVMRAPRTASMTRELFEVGDGAVATIRSITPRDAEALVRFHERLSYKSVWMRYFYPHLELEAPEVAHLTDVDGRDRVALVVECDGELIAVGRYDRLNDPRQAEVAFVVADAYQQHGIATVLLDRLAARARKAGITCLIAEVLAENNAMLSVFHAAGYPTESTFEGGTVELKMTLVPVDDMRGKRYPGTRQTTRVPPPSAP